MQFKIVEEPKGNQEMICQEMWRRWEGRQILERFNLSTSSASLMEKEAGAQEQCCGFSMASQHRLHEEGFSNRHRPLPSS